MGIVMGGGYRGLKGGGKPMVLQTSTSREGSKPDTIRERERERKADADGASRGAVNTLPFATFNPAPLSIIPPIFVSLRTDCSFAANEVVISRVSTVTPLERARRKKKKKKMGRISGVETIGECGETRGGRLEAARFGEI